MAYLCVEEGIYRVEPHNHKDEKAADECSKKFAIRMALDRDSWRRVAERLEMEKLEMQDAAKKATE